MKTPRAKQAFLSQWRITRRKGAPRYILTTGLLSFALPLAILTVLTNAFVKGRGWPDLWSADSLFVLILYLMFGTPYGLVLWKLQERRYRKYNQFK